jgi:hypothetical protein
MNKRVKNYLIYGGVGLLAIVIIKSLSSSKKSSDVLNKELDGLSFTEHLRANSHDVNKNIEKPTMSDTVVESKDIDKEKNQKLDSWSMTKLVASGKVPEEIASNINPVNDNALFDANKPPTVKHAYIKTFRNSESQQQEKIYEQPKVSELPKTKFARQSKLSGPVTTLTGMAQTTDRGAMFKAGTRVLAILPDKLTITSGETVYTSLTALGSADQKVPNNLTFVGKAKLNKSERRVEIAIENCVNTKDSSPPMPCVAVVKDILGDNGLTGKIYDPSNWQLIIASVGAYINTSVLSQLTTSATQNGQTVDQTTSNQIRQSIAGTVTAVANRLISNLDKSGTEIVLAQGAIVQIFFTETTQTWNDQNNT